MERVRTILGVFLGGAMLAGCGMYVPSKHLLRSDSIVVDPSGAEVNQTREGRAEANIIANIRCEIQSGVYRAASIMHNGKTNAGYLRESWGTQVTLKLVWDEQSSLTPGISFIHPKPDMQSRSIGLGASASSHATRLETVTFLFENSALYAEEVAWLRNGVDNSEGKLHDCKALQTGPMIESDLKIADFIVDKATIASLGIANTDGPEVAPFSTFQEDITFVGAFGGSVTPVWKLTRFTANAAANLLSGTRTVTGDVLITLGPLAKDEKTGLYLHKLGELPSAQHNFAFGAGATANQVVSQTR